MGFSQVRKIPSSYLEETAYGATKRLAFVRDNPVDGPRSIHE